MNQLVLLLWKGYVDPFFFTNTTHLIKIKVASTALKMLPSIKTRSISACMHKFSSHMWYRRWLYSYKILYILGNHHVISLSKIKSSSPQWACHMFLLFLQHSFPIFINIFSRHQDCGRRVVYSTTQRDASTPRICVYVVHRKDVI